MPQEKTMQHVYTIMPTLTDHVEEICQDIVAQYNAGIANCALFMAKLVPEGDPVIDKASQFAADYVRFRDRLRELGVDCGILVQCTIGHGYPLNQRSPFVYYQNLSDGQEQFITCPYDRSFQDYLRDQLEKVAALAPKVIMVDDDFRLMYRGGRGCACPLHMAAYHRAGGRGETREEMLAYLCRQDAEGEVARRQYVETQRESLLQSARAMREGIDAVDPTLPGLFCCVGPTTEFAAEIAHILAGAGNPAVVRVNNGNYSPAGAHYLSNVAYRAADEIHRLQKGGVDIVLAETDTCPQNRYSTGTQSLHAHYTASILEGACGAKHWITRLATYEPRSGLAYRKTLAEYSGFYHTLAALVPTLQWEGCRIPLPQQDTYRFTEGADGWYINAWTSCVLERWGFPVYFSAKPGGVTFLEGDADVGLSDEELKEILSGTAVVDSACLQHLYARGLGAYTGVAVAPYHGEALSFERIHESGNRCNVQVGCCQLQPLSDTVRSLSTVYHLHNGKEEIPLFPGVTVFSNTLGGTVIVTAGSPRAAFHYTTAFSYLCESRKQQFATLLREIGGLPVYYAGDSEIYMKTAMTQSGERFCALFNLSLDVLDELPLSIKEKVKAVRQLQKDGSFAPVDYTAVEGGIVLHGPLYTLGTMMILLEIA